MIFDNSNNQIIEVALSIKGPARCFLSAAQLLSQLEILEEFEDKVSRLHCKSIRLDVSQGDYSSL